MAEWKPPALAESEEKVVSRPFNLLPSIKKGNTEESNRQILLVVRI